jgi:hypothetical protein
MPEVSPEYKKRIVEKLGFAPVDCLHEKKYHNGCCRFLSLCVERQQSGDCVMCELSDDEADIDRYRIIEGQKDIYEEYWGYKARDEYDPFEGIIRELPQWD